MLDTSGQETPIYVFTEGAGAGAGGYSPLAGLIQDPAGNLYGTTFAGGAGAGAVFMLSPGKVTVLYSFTGGADGGAPAAGVIRDTSGNLYGTTELGGLDTGGHHCCGVVFRVDTSGHETVLYTFTGGDDGSEPVAGLVRDSQGNLYGTTEDGGAYGLGVIFKLDSSGNETVLAESPSADVALPKAGLFLDPQGNLYGTTSEGGTNRCGNVFKIDPVGNFTDLFSFTCGAEGGNPLAGVIEDADGNLYGTAGNVYKLDASGNETVLYTFTGGDDGGGKVSGLVRDSVGNLYGTTSNGGNSNNGVVFKVSPAGQETVLLDLPGGASGSRTKASLLLDSAGNLYGTTPLGGIEDGGVVFEVSR